MPQYTESLRTIIEMVRMPAPDFKRYMREILMDQLEAGYDFFTWSLPDIPPVPEPTGQEETPPWTGVTGETLRHWRLTEGLTQTALGNMLGMGGQTISDLEREKSPMSSTMQQRLWVLMHHDAEHE
jgi:hypothetical protein